MTSSIGLIYKEIKDIRVISLIRKYLQAGVMENGVLSKTEEGVPQGRNLSPLLSNIMLNELDKELTRRGLRFVRYADDSNIYVKSRKAANRVMESITRFIEGTLKLTVNKEKSTVDRPWRLKFLGYSFYHVKGGVEFRVHEKSIKKLRQKTKFNNLQKLGVNRYKAWEFANTRKSYWRTANSPILVTTITNA